MPAQYLATDYSAGDECSSSYEGRQITLEEGYLVHPTHADAWVDKGDPIVDNEGGRIVGVALISGIDATTLISIDTEGIWYLDVVASDDAGASAITLGDEIFINRTTAVLSKITNIATHQPFGYSLGTAAGDDAAHLVAVKVHHDPTVDAQIAQFTTVATTLYGKSMRATLADPGQSEGLCGYHEGHVDGVQAGGIYNFGSWINVDAGATLNGSIMTPYEGGVYTAEAQAAARIVFAGQHMAILTGAPASLHAWRLNTTQTIDALIAAANAGSVGYVAGALSGANKVGGAPLYDIVGHGVRFVYLYDAAD